MSQIQVNLPRSYSSEFPLCLTSVALGSHESGNINACLGKVLSICLAHSKCSANISYDDDNDERRKREENDNEAEQFISALTMLSRCSLMRISPLFSMSIQTFPFLKRPLRSLCHNSSFGSIIVHLKLLIVTRCSRYNGSLDSVKTQLRSQILLSFCLASSGRL